MHNNIRMKHLGKKPWKQNPHKLNQCACIKKQFMMANVSESSLHMPQLLHYKNKTLEREN